MFKQNRAFDVTVPQLEAPWGPLSDTLWERAVLAHIRALAGCESLEQPIERAVTLLKRCSGKILVCGNGGSAAHAQHLAAELVVRFQRDRPPIPALALTTDTSILTAASNDLGYHEVFSRQVEALARPGDVLIGISTSGKSANVYSACQKASEMGCQVITMTGMHGMYGCVSDVELRVPSIVTARVQEIHTLIIHVLCEGIEA